MMRRSWGYGWTVLATLSVAACAAFPFIALGTTLMFPSDIRVAITFGGDVTLGYHYQEYFDDQVAQGKARDEMFQYGFRELKPALANSDLFVVNLECPFTDRGEKIPKNFNFRARPEFISSLIAGGVQAVSLANNHMMDYGSVGLLDTLAALDAARIPHFGAGGNLSEARQPAILERNGIKIALLGYFFLGEHNIEPPEVVASDKSPGVAGHPSRVGAMRQMLKEDIPEAKAKANLVIPFFHWGREGNRSIEPYQRELAHLAIDLGAAAVVGSHPHVLQGMELYQGAPILYSLGNLVFGGNWDPKTKESALVKVIFTRDNGHLSDEVIPLHIDRFPRFPLQPIVVTGDEADAVMRHLVEYSRPLGSLLPALLAFPQEPRLQK